MSRRITTIPALIAHFGGPAATARALRTTPQKVCNWRRVGHMPPEHFKAHKKLLKAHQLRTPDDLWGWTEVPESWAGPLEAAE